ncbi:MAG TPA: phosphate acetyltransferase [Longimicrobiales bacterium]|nr:phosphate acetyltransferase [Longimicrobiales bacterium]
MSAFLEGIQQRAATLQRRIVFPEGEDKRTIQAVAELHRRSLVQPIIVGRQTPIREALAQAGLPDGAVTVLDPGCDERSGPFANQLYQKRWDRGLTRTEAAEMVREPLMFGALLVRAGEADGSVAGAVHTTASVLRAAILGVGTAPGIKVVSSSFYMVVPPFRGEQPEVLTFTDGAVVPNPDALQLADIAVAAAEARRKIVGDEPCVAFLSYSTRGSAEGPTVDLVREATARFRERMPDVAADGELQVDAAILESISRSKAPESPVKGRANVLVFPDLDAGNIAYKLVQRLAHAEAIGPILQGLDRPCNDLSRGASWEDILNVACIAALLA